MIPSTVNRVPMHTAQKVNNKIRRRMERRISYYARHPEKIDERLQQLEREWDIERTLEANAGAVAVGSVLLGALSHKRWLLLPVFVGGFLLYHAVNGWCPPLPVWRRFGVRTQTEIDEERYALKALRGDFRKMPPQNDSREFSNRVMDVVRH
ncbi:MAG TPA: DUF2892 domain-containing protein [Rickettsiales bacterium]|nr:DUF2892 domain-containing protein [Rickettsiales bacterium]